MATKSKVHKGTAKRIKLTGSGKMLRRNAYGNHLLSKKSPGRKRNIAKSQVLATSRKRSTRRLLGV